MSSYGHPATSLQHPSDIPAGWQLLQVLPLPQKLGADMPFAAIMMNPASKQVGVMWVRGW